MKTIPKPFHPLARALHWLMAILVLAMLFIGAGMVTSVTQTHETLIHIHKPLGIAILLLAVIRIGVRLTHRPPPLPADLSPLVRFGAHASHLVLYGLLLAMPLIGWAMVSASGEPVMLSPSLRLPSLVPANPVLFAWLRNGHAWLAWLLFLVVLVHLAAALYHGLIRRDGVLRSMLGGKAAPADPEDTSG
ncbi:cytochrome b561 [Luteibacter sp. Sphag1AF]|uniref:cytochrome b n=1 Tax=Luteibacter sp. Sphag1AF TaxID=2587031 RepID=UPI001611F10E|nr:cytochrome b [Luteibacter sp. Sphag1AF]MBB3227959.1 cytochrome b561 [Luteibacter sp. Sphag1AF]